MLQCPEIPELDPRVPIASQFNGAAGHFQHRADVFILAIRRRQLRDPVALTATVAHELAHVRLLGERRISPDRGDQEQLTDLATVSFGLGIFTANAAFDYSQNQFGWQTSQLGYLGEALFGYALAYYAHMRAEEDPSWAKALDTNPHHAGNWDQQTLFLGGLLDEINAQEAEREPGDSSLSRVEEALYGVVLENTATDGVTSELEGRFVAEFSRRLYGLAAATTTRVDFWRKPVDWEDFKMVITGALIEDGVCLPGQAAGLADALFDVIKANHKRIQRPEPRTTR